MKVFFLSGSFAAKASTLIHVLRVVVRRHVVIDARDTATKLVLSRWTFSLMLAI